MGKIFLWANYWHYQTVDFAQKTDAIQQIIFLRDRIVAELRSRGCEVLAVPDDFNLTTAIEWINYRSHPGDIALAIQFNLVNYINLQGVQIFHVAYNIERKKHAELLLLLLSSNLSHVNSRGSHPDTIAELGKLAFCRQITIPSLQMVIGVFTNSKDGEIITNYYQQLVEGIVEGLMAWSREVAGIESNQNITQIAIQLTYPAIQIVLNDRVYEERGVLINGNPCVSVDFCDRLGLNITLSPDIHFYSYQGIVYIKAVELSNYHLSLSWDNLSRTLAIRSILSIPQEQLDKIMGQGKTSEVQLTLFLKTYHENILNNDSDIAKLYREEAGKEGVNHDIAFCQMCLETSFLYLDNELETVQNNFARLGTLDGNLASFPDRQSGVRAHIQHLKAYASLEPLVHEAIDPRFQIVARGIAPTVFQLSGRWSADPSYGKKVMVLIRQLYQSAKLL